MSTKLENERAHLQSTVCGLEDELKTVKADLTSALSRESAYREALEEIIKKEEWSSRYCSGHPDVITIARRALDRKPEEPVWREVDEDEIITRMVEIIETAFNDSTSRLPLAKLIAKNLLKTFRVERKP